MFVPIFPFLTWRVKLSAHGRPPLHGSRGTILALAICWRLSFLWENVRQVDQNGTYEFHIISQLAFWGTHESGVFFANMRQESQQNSEDSGEHLPGNPAIKPTIYGIWGKVLRIWWVDFTHGNTEGGQSKRSRIYMILQHIHIPKLVKRNHGKPMGFDPVWSVLRNRHPRLFCAWLSVGPAGFVLIKHHQRQNIPKPDLSPWHPLFFTSSLTVMISYAIGAFEQAVKCH